MRKLVALATIAVALSFALPLLARADATVSGTVTTTDPAGDPVPDALVAITNATNRYATVTDASGHFSVAAVASGTYDVVAYAPGQEVGKASGVAVASSDVTQDVSCTATNQKFEALGVYGAQVAGIAADGQSGVFYAATSVIPQLFRTADYGGTWTPVTMQLDDADDGLSDDNSGAGLATSGFPGEVATAVMGTVYASTDFGVTWRALSVPGGGGPSFGQLFWGHAGSTNVLLYVLNGTTYRADMSAPTPTFAAQSASYLSNTDPNARMAVANGADGAWVAVVSGTGNLSVYDLAENPPATAVSSLAGLPHPPTFVRLGGEKSNGVPPDAVMVYAHDDAHHLVMATKSGGTTYGSVSAAVAVSGCGEGPGSIGSLSPQSSGTTGNGTVSQCFVTKSGTAAPTLAMVNGINNNTGLVFDAGYDRSTNFVLISADGNRGLVKSASEVSGVPQFPSGNVNASAGTASNSGGVSVHGLTVPVVKDSAYGPTGADQVAVELSGSGGGLSVASDDGGATFVTVVPKGGASVDWWTGASGAWLAYGHGGAGSLLSVYGDWDSGDAALMGPNVTGTDATALGITGPTQDFSLSAIKGVPGEDVVFLGTALNGNQPNAGGTIVRATVSGAGSAVTISGVTVLDGSASSGWAVRALAYCPTAGSDSSIADTLLAAVGNNGTGSVIRITGATGGTPSATSVHSGVVMNDVRAHCGSGTVYVGAGTNTGGPSGHLYKSTDGGATFGEVAISAPGLPPNLNVQVVAVSPDDANEVLIAGNSEGIIARSTDGGTSWTVVNDPHGAGGRNFLSEGVGDLEIPPAAAPLSTGRTRAVSTASASLVGTGGGLFAADFTVQGGGGGGGCTSPAQCNDQDACTTDTCVSGVCHHDEPATAAALTCELAALAAIDDCADAKTAKFFAKQGTRANGLAQKLNGASGKKVTKLRKQLDGLLGKLGAKAGKAKRSAETCRQEIQAQIQALRTLLSNVGG